MSMHRIWAEAVEAQLRLMALYGVLPPMRLSRGAEIAQTAETGRERDAASTDWLCAYI